MLVGLLVIGILLGFILLGVVLALERRVNKAFKALDIAHIDTMTGIAFERYVGALLKTRGYRVSYTALSGDYGVDIIAKKHHEKIAVQCKRTTGSVGVSAIQQVVAGSGYYKCAKSMAVTNSSFTANAKELAAIYGCELVDRLELGLWATSDESDDSTASQQSPPPELLLRER